MLALLGQTAGWTLDERRALAEVGDEPVRILVTFSDETTAQDRASNLVGLGTSPPRRIGRNVFAVDVPSRSAPGVAFELDQRPGVVAAELDRPMHILDAPSDSLFSYQWALRNTGSNLVGLDPSLLGIPGADIYGDPAWATTTGNAAIVVGMLDSGIDPTHPDLAPNVWRNPGGIFGCPAGSFGLDLVNLDCSPFDDNGHGTHVSGTIGAVGDDGFGVAGIAWDVSLLPMKFLGADGSGLVSHAIEALHWLVEAKQAGVNLRIVNASFGSPFFLTAFLDELAWSAANDILVVAAAGNDGMNADLAPIYPCAYPVDAIVCVANSSHEDLLHSSSNYGPLSVDLAAPGTDIVSTIPLDLEPPLGWRLSTGTSMAAPHVSGTAALVLSTGYQSVSSLKGRILAGTDAVPGLSGFVLTGGRLNACKAIPGCNPAIPPEAPTAVVAGAGDERAVVSWASPWNNPRFPRTGYVVAADPGTVMASAGADATTTTVVDLTNGSTYTFSVAATNAVGTGPFSSPSNAVTPRGMPIAIDDRYDATSGAVLAISAVTGVLANDVGGGSQLAAVLAMPPGHGTVILNADGSFVYNPEAGWAGVDSFTYTASGAGLVSAPATVEIDVAAVSGAVLRNGYLLVASDGGVFAFGGAQHLGDGPAGAVDIEATPAGDGYWVVTDRGQVQPFGSATSLGGSPPLQAGERVASLSVTPTGRGYWIFTSLGRVFPYGDAIRHGDLAGIALNGPVLDSVATPSGGGYWMVASDGGIFSFGDARFHGSMGGQRLNQPVMSMAPDPDGVGYWLVASDGGIFAFDAVFYGSTGSITLNKPISGMVPGSAGYLMVAEDGGIFAFGDVAFYGSLGNNPPSSPVVAVALLPAGPAILSGRRT